MFQSDQECIEFMKSIDTQLGDLITYLGEVPERLDRIEIEGGRSMERLINYKGYRIAAKVHPVDGKRDPDHAGKWTAGEYTVGKFEGGGYSEKPVVHGTRFCDTEDEAIQVTLQLAMKYVDLEIPI